MINISALDSILQNIFVLMFTGIRVISETTIQPDIFHE